MVPRPLTTAVTWLWHPNRLSLSGWAGCVLGAGLMIALCFPQRTTAVTTCRSCLEDKETEEAIRDDGVSLFSRTRRSVWKAERSGGCPDLETGCSVHPRQLQTLLCRAA